MRESVHDVEHSVELFGFRLGRIYKEEVICGMCKSRLAGCFMRGWFITWDWFKKY